MRLLRLVATMAVALFYWLLISRLTDAAEPWDAVGYWTAFYPLSLLLAVFGGWLIGRHGWIAGLIVTFAQLPVMIANAGTGPLLPIGVIFLIILSLPAVLAGMWGAYLAQQP